MTEFGFRMDAAPPEHRRPWLLISAVLGFVVLSAFVVARTFQPPADFQGKGEGEVKVTVVKGDTGRQIGVRLKDAEVVASVEAWLATIANDPRATKISPGEYNMRRHMSAADAFALILDPTSRAYLKLVIPEGMRVSEILDRAAKVTGIAREDFEKALDSPATIGLPTIANGKPEGFLFPATYEIAKEDNAVSILKKMTTRWAEAAKSLELTRRAAATGYTPYQILIIASIVEVESGPKDYSKVARVVENRLRQPMRLQLDSTVNYGLGLKELHLTQVQLDTPTAFNTYLNDGLPPTPIGNPGEAAIEAVLEPAKGPWLYFVTVDVKKQITKFASTYEEFLKLKAEFQNSGA